MAGFAEPGKEVEFADMFAQTLAYGLFSARALNSVTSRFTLADAAKLIPKTNPFLRDFFDLVPDHATARQQWGV